MRTNLFIVMSDEERRSLNASMGVSGPASRKTVKFWANKLMANALAEAVRDYPYVPKGGAKVELEDDDVEDDDVDLEDDDDDVEEEEEVVIIPAPKKVRRKVT